jgi:hypothetical protein
LYVSSKTVEYDPGNVFTKLGVQSRRELRLRRSEFERPRTLERYTEPVRPGRSALHSPASQQDFWAASGRP